MTATGVALEVRDLTLQAGGRRDGRVLLRGLSFDVRPGERWTVLGPNGAGKTSLLAALAGVFPIAAGSVRVDGRSLADWKPVLLAERRAWCPQFWSDPFPATVRDTARLAYDRAGWWSAPAGAVEADVDAVLARLDLSALAHADVRTLSGGERQRVAIATTLLQGAPLLLLDEPASHLDLGHQHQLLDLLDVHAAACGSVVASLHDLNLAWDLATHVVLVDGRGGAQAGPRDEQMTPTRLGVVFGVPMFETTIGTRRRFWPGRADDREVR